MNDLLINFLRETSQTNHWFVLLPEIALALLAISMLGLDLFKKSPNAPSNPASRLNTRISIIGQIGIFIAISCFGSAFYEENRVLFGGLLEQSEKTQFMRCFFVFASISITLLSDRYLGKFKLPKAEYLHLSLLVCAGFMLLVQSAHFILFFVVLEMVTVAFYVLVAFQRTHLLSLEAGLKYLTLGALSSTILLFGIVLLYGIAGNPEMAGFVQDGFQFKELQQFISLHPENLIVRLGALLVISGICFKIGAVPFQIWVPDVYQGAPTPTTAYLATASKAAGIFILIQLLQGPFLALSAFLIPFLSVICAVTILYGNIAATGQTNIKRLIGLSGISHAGYLLLGVIAAISVPFAFDAVLFYLTVYMVSSILAFGTITYLGQVEESTIELRDFNGLLHRSPFLGSLGLISLGSLAGIPPLGGFIGKLLLFWVAYQAGLFFLLAVAIIGVVISIYYYFGWLRAIVLRPEGEELVENPSESSPLLLSERCFFISLMILVVILGLFPGLLLNLI